MKKLKVFAVSVVFASNLLFPVSTLGRHEFADVPLSYPQYEAISFLYDEGVISGYDDGTFKPERIVTRAEMVKFALSGAGIQVDKVIEAPFNDVPLDKWYTPYIFEAKKRGIVGGFEDGSFKPELVVNRVEALKMIFAARNLRLSPVSKSIFEDISIDSWYAPYVQLVADKGLMKVEGVIFGRDEGMQRRYVAEILYKLIQIEQVGKIRIFPAKMLIYILLLWGAAVATLLLDGWKGKVKWYVLLSGPGGLLYVFSKATFHLLKKIANEEMIAKTGRILGRRRQVRKVVSKLVINNLSLLVKWLWVVIIIYFLLLMAYTSITTYYYKQSLPQVEYLN